MVLGGGLLQTHASPQEGGGVHSKRGGSAHNKFCEASRAQVLRARVLKPYDRYASWAPTSLAQRALAPERGGAWIALPPEFSPFSRFAKTRYLASTGGEKRRRSRA
jgi:hypothetical protein